MCAVSVPQGRAERVRHGHACARRCSRGRDASRCRSARCRPAGPTDAIVRVTMTTICGTDVHILRGEYPVAPGRIVGHEPVGVIHELGSAVDGLSRSVTACSSARSRRAARCFFCQHGDGAQCSGHEDQWEMIGGWRLGNSADGVQADYFRVPYAQANLAKIPDDLSDEQCVLLADIASTGISAAETRPASGSARPSRSSPRARSGCARRPARG